MHATALPVLNVDLWILRINVNHKKEREYFRGSRSVCGLSSSIGHIWIVSSLETVPGELKYLISLGKNETFSHMRP